MVPQRTTSQRIKILKYLRSVKTHPSAEMVYAAVKKDLPAISLATVYRNLNLLAEQGEILKLEINGEFRFDGNMCGHTHAVCTRCGKLFDLMDRKIPDYVMKNFRLKGFTQSCVHIIFKGTCKSCK
jgi:Fe2+ or Zn2+ uptake regulation protein